MRPRFLTGLSVSVLILLAVLFWHHSRKQPVAPATLQDAQSLVRLTNSQSNSKPAIATHPVRNPSNPVSAIDGVIASNSVVQARELRMKQAVEGKNVPVSFYGMVVDQDNKPLSGVRVALGLRHNVYAIPNSPESKNYETLSQEDLQKMLNPTTELATGDNGRFQWTDSNITGDVLGVGSIIKEGYEAEPGQRSFSVGSGNFDAPAVFKMWSTNIHEQLITGEKQFQIVPDGRPYFIDLIKGTIAESGEGDLKVWIKYTNQVIRGQTHDWSSEIDVINGGLLEEPLGSPMYLAPADGFAPSFQLQQQIKGGQSGETGSRQFYVVLKNGQEYGRITIDLYAPYNDQIPGLVRLAYAINPSGSRNLAPPP
jgi:hypothetical protein